MRKRQAIVLAAIILAFVAGLAWQLSQPREPVYQGKPLSYWLEGYDYASRTETSHQSADGAMDELGTNAIPTLLRMLQVYDSPLKIKFLSFISKQHILKIRSVRASQINLEGMAGFEKLGATAKSAVPSLAKIYETDNSEFSVACAARSLAAMGPDAKGAIPVLLKGISSTNVLKRYATTEALGMIHEQPELVVPVLIESLNDKSNPTRQMSADALGRFGLDAMKAVPALIKILDDPEPGMRARIIFALRKIDPEAAANLTTNSSPIGPQTSP